MKRPSFQFYPADWRNNAKLRRCSPAARGAWMDVMCLLHDSDTYGVLRWPLKDIAQAAGVPPSLLRELIQKDVLKGCESGVCEPFVYVPRSGRKDGPAVTLLQAAEGPVWYSSRMVRDEYVRTIRGESSRFGGDGNDTPKGSRKPAPKPPFGDGSTSTSTSSYGEVVASDRACAHAPAPAEPDPPEANGIQPTAAGLACRAMRAAGMQGVNPGDPRLTALLAQGATLDELAAMAAEAVAKGKGWAWALKAVEGRRADAAAIALQPQTAQAAETPYERRMREKMQQWAPAVAAKAPGASAPEPVPFIDMEAPNAAALRLG